MPGQSRDRGPRIVAGRFRGRRLRVPTGGGTRPARALVRRSIFDILQARVEGCRWLDLFAGSGSLGIEALSRGAAHVTFIESSTHGARCLSRNLEDLDLAAPEILVVRQRIPQVFRGPPSIGAPYEFISMDPPFAISRHASRLQDLCTGLADACNAGWFAPRALLIWEEPGDAPYPVPGGFRETDRRSYGTSRVRFFEVQQEAG